MRIIHFSFGLVLLLTSCISISSQGQRTVGDHAQVPSLRHSLCGEWTAKLIDSDEAYWKSIVGCHLYVYEDKELPPPAANSAAVPLLAELIVQDRSKSDHLAFDTEPVFGSAERLYFGPIGSCYAFTYKLEKEGLTLDATSQGRHHLRLTFKRTNDYPGKPRFPMISGR